MKKAINLQAQLHCGPDQDRQQLGAALESTFARVNPGMQLTVNSLSPPDGAGNATVRVYIEGEQEPADPFAPLANGALHKAIAALAPGPQGTPYGVHGVQEVEDDDDTGLVLPPHRTSASAPHPAATQSPGPPAEERAQAGAAPAQHPAPTRAEASAAEPASHAAAAGSSAADYAAGRPDTAPEGPAAAPQPAPYTAPETGAPLGHPAAANQIGAPALESPLTGDSATGVPDTSPAASVGPSATETEASASTGDVASASSAPP